MAMLRARHMKSCVLMWDGWLEESKQDRSSLTLNHWLCPLLCSSPLAEQQRVYSAAFWEWSAVERTGTQPLLQLQPAADATDLFARRKHLLRRVFLPHSLLSHFIVIELRGGGGGEKQRSYFQLAALHVCDVLAGWRYENKSTFNRM